MKLLVCLKCSDVFSLRQEDRKCLCGKTSGKYLADGLFAEFTGPCLPLGFDNNSFEHAIRNQPEKNWGKDFTAFVIQKECPTMKRIGPAPKIETEHERMMRFMSEVSEVLHPPLAKPKKKALSKKKVKKKSN